MKFIGFVAEFIRHPRQVGAIAQSSPFLARKMVRQIPNAAEVIEFGPGTGPVTKEILRNLPQNGKLTCFEINPRFCEQLKTIKDSRMKIINDDVRNCRQYVKNIDCIVSSLPLASFDRSMKEEILALTAKCRTYIQFQYNPFLKSKLKKYFRDVEVKFVPLNIPPAFVYVSKNPRFRAVCDENKKRRNIAAIISSRLVRKVLKTAIVYSGLFWNFLNR